MPQYSNAMVVVTVLKAACDMAVTVFMEVEYQRPDQIRLGTTTQITCTHTGKQLVLVMPLQVVNCTYVHACNDSESSMRRTTSLCEV